MIKAPFKRKSTPGSNVKDSSKVENSTNLSRATSAGSSSVNSMTDVCNDLENAANVYAEIDVNDFLRPKHDNSVDDMFTNPDELNFIESFFNKNDSKNNFFQLSNVDDQIVDVTEQRGVHEYINTCTAAAASKAVSDTKACVEDNTKKIKQIADQNPYDIDSCSSYLHMRPVNELAKSNEISDGNSLESAKKTGLSANLPTKTINILFTTIKDKLTKQDDKLPTESENVKNSSEECVRNDELSDKTSSTKFTKLLKSKLKGGFKFTFSKHERICPKCSKNWSDKPEKQTEDLLNKNTTDKCCCPNENCNDHEHIDDSHYVNEHTYSELMDVSKNMSTI